MGDKDTEAPPEVCVAKLQAAKVAGAPAGVGRLAALAFTARRRPSRSVVWSALIATHFTVI
jgi:hypothetical protein